MVVYDDSTAECTTLCRGYDLADGQKNRWDMAAGLVREFFRWIYKGMHIALLDSHDPPVSKEDLTIRLHAAARFTHGSCTNFTNVQVPDRTFVESLRSKYKGSAGHLLFDVMPMADCNPDVPRFEQRFAGLTDNRVSHLPARIFLRGGMHVDVEGGILLSDMVAQQILELEG